MLAGIDLFKIIFIASQQMAPLKFLQLFYISFSLNVIVLIMDISMLIFLLYILFHRLTTHSLCKSHFQNHVTQTAPLTVSCPNGQHGIKVLAQHAAQQVLTFFIHFIMKLRPRTIRSSWQKLMFRNSHFLKKDSEAEGKKRLSSDPRVAASIPE